jgi:hypothetical protein
MSAAVITSYRLLSIAKPKDFDDLIVRGENAGSSQ